MFAVPFALRSLVDHLVARERQRAPVWDGTSYDSTSMPVDLELPARLYRPGEIESVLTVHVTDVDGGFGVARYQIARWRKLLEQGKVPAELLAQLPDPLDLGGSSYVLALLERYSRAAYHVIASRRLGIVHNHPLALRTSHGGIGNMGAGWAADCGNDEQLDDELVKIGRESLRREVLELHEVTSKPVIIVPHRVWERARREDTGRDVWRYIVLVVLAELGREVAVAGYETRGGSGLWIPTSWDDAAHYDVKGRPVAGVAAAA